MIPIQKKRNGLGFGFNLVIFDFIERLFVIPIKLLPEILSYA